MNKRLLSVLLAVLMLLSLLPVGVSAAEEETAPTAEPQLPAVTTSVEAAPAEAKEPVMETLPMENEPREYSNERFDYMTQGDAAYISRVYGLSGDTLTIPSELDGYPVKGLNNFYNWQVRHLILPDSVEVIVGDLSLESLTTLTVGAGLKTLDQSQISNCIALQRIDVSDSNPNMKSIDSIVYNAAGDTVLVFPFAWGDTYTIPAGVTTIGQHAFWECHGLTGITAAAADDRI